MVVDTYVRGENVAENSMRVERVHASINLRREKYNISHARHLENEKTGAYRYTMTHARYPTPMRPYDRSS